MRTGEGRDAWRGKLPSGYGIRVEADRWARVSALFAEAMELPETERAAFLEDRCGADGELRIEIESLIAAAADGADHFERLQRDLEPDREEHRGVSESVQTALEAAIGDRYRIESLLDRGGMGLVFSAVDRKHGRRVAIKTIRPGHAAGLTPRFEREIRITANLQHPHILPLLDSGIADGVLFYIMPFVEGESLKKRLDRLGRFSPAEAVRIALEIGDGLAHAHARGVLHRDVKPSNVLLAEQHVQIVDFGIARQTLGIGGADLTATGQGIGTPNYMAPEQLAGESTARSDVFSLGAVLYEMLTGRVWRREAAGGEPSWKHVPTDLRPVIERAVDPVADRRWTRVTDLTEALREWQAGDAGSPARAAAESQGILGRLRRLVGGGARPSRDRRSIAVLPFDNLNGDERTEYFSDGITDDIIAHLSSIRELKVISRTSVMRYKGTDVSIPRIGRDLGVATVLEGSVRRVDDRVRVVAQLIDAGADEHLWSETFDRELTDIFRIQSEVAERIAAALEARISAAERSLIQRRPTSDVEAHDFYLKGRHLWKRRSQAALEEAEGQFGLAIARDPLFAPAYAGLGDVYLLQAGYAYREEIEALERARTAVGRALEIDERLAEAHASMGQIRRTDRDWPGEEAEYRRAIELNPNYATAHQWYATLLAAMGRPEEARFEIDRALELDPLSHAIRVTSGVVRMVARDYEGALADFERTVELEPRFFSAYAWLTIVLAYLGQYDRGMDAWAKVRELHPDPRLADANRAFLCAVTGRAEEAYEALEGGAAPERGWSGIIHAQLGEIDEAFRLLEEALDDTSWRMFFLWRSLVFYIKVAPWFDPLRADPRFDGLLRRLNMVAPTDAH